MNSPHILVVTDYRPGYCPPAHISPCPAFSPVHPPGEKTASWYHPTYKSTYLPVFEMLNARRYIVTFVGWLRAHLLVFASWLWSHPTLKSTCLPVFKMFIREDAESHCSQQIYFSPLCAFSPVVCKLALVSSHLQIHLLVSSHQHFLLRQTNLSTLPSSSKTHSPIFYLSGFDSDLKLCSEGMNTVVKAHRQPTRFKLIYCISLVDKLKRMIKRCTNDLPSPFKYCLALLHCLLASQIPVKLLLQLIWWLC